jgi:aspartate/methionine/tyrosine aminotransferase
VDEIYQGLTYDHAPSIVLTIDQDAIVINSFSKYFSMTGWRLGWMVVPEHMVAAVEKLAQNWFICPSSIAQYAAVACFEPQQIAIFEARKAEMQARRDYLVPACELGFSIPVTPDGAFYVYANCSAFTDDADRFAKDILQQAGVVITPGQDFGLLPQKTTFVFHMRTVWRI